MGKDLSAPLLEGGFFPLRFFFFFWQHPVRFVRSARTREQSRAPGVATGDGDCRRSTSTARIPPTPAPVKQPPPAPTQRCTTIPPPAPTRRASRPSLPRQKSPRAPRHATGELRTPFAASRRRPPRCPPYPRRRCFISGRSPRSHLHGVEAGGCGRSPCGPNQWHLPLRDVRHDVQDEGASSPNRPVPLSSPLSLSIHPFVHRFAHRFTDVFMLYGAYPSQSMIDHDQETVRRMLVDNPEVTRALFRVRFPVVWAQFILHFLN